MEITDNSLKEEFELDVQKSLAVIREEQKASVSLLQRRLKLGFGRAVTVMAHLEKEGIVGPARGSQPRVINSDKLEQVINCGLEVGLNRKESLLSCIKAVHSISSALPSAGLVTLEASETSPPNADGVISIQSTQVLPCPESLIPSADALSNATLKMLADADDTPSKYYPQGRKAFMQQKIDEIAQVMAAPATGSYLSLNQPTKEEMAELDAYVANAPEFKTLPQEIRMCVIGYLPGPARFHTAAFLENLKRNPPANELITFSDQPEFEPTVKMKRSIETPDLMEKQHGIANLAFYLAYCIAWERGFTHFLYLESDCRVSKAPINNSATEFLYVPWDTQLLWQFTDAQNEHREPLIVAGSVMLDNPFKSDPETARRANELLDRWNPNRNSPDAKERNKPIPVRAQRGVKDNTSMVGCNGAGAIYSVAGMRELFPEIKDPKDATILALAKDGLPYDWELAKRLWRTHKAGAFDRVAHLSAMFSSYGDVLSTEEERLQMLRSGSAVLVHQVKSNTIE